MASEVKNAVLRRWQTVLCPEVFTGRPFCR